MNPMGMMPGPRPTSTMKKEILTFKSSVLYPPPPGKYFNKRKTHIPDHLFLHFSFPFLIKIDSDSSHV